MHNTVLICLAHYLPGWKWGGPTRSIANLVEHLGDEFNFRILTVDRDFGDRHPYPNIASDQWRQVGKAQVMYLSQARQHFVAIAKLLNETQYDTLYLNSFFHPVFTIMPLLSYRLGLARRRPCILAPRGEFAASALSIKAAKKIAYLRIARLFSLYDGLRWQASSEFEAEDVRRGLAGVANDIIIAGNLPRRLDRAAFVNTKAPSIGAPLRVALLSRLSRMKNVEFALQVLSTCDTPVEFDIWGTIEDRGYWQACQTLIAAMPRHVTVTYRGGADQANTANVLADYDLMFLPSLGENYGHVIAESLSVGTPVLISDRTPWRNLAKAGVGWDLALEAGPPAFHDALHQAVKRRDLEGAAWRTTVIEYAERVLLPPETLEENRHMIRTTR